MRKCCHQFFYIVKGIIHVSSLFSSVRRSRATHSILGGNTFSNRDFERSMQLNIALSRWDNSRDSLYVLLYALFIFFLKIFVIRLSMIPFFSSENCTVTMKYKQAASTSATFQQTVMSYSKAECCSFSLIYQIYL